MQAPCGQIDGFTPRQPPRYSYPMKIARSGPRRASAEGYLDGQLLIAMPVMSDPRFARSVIYLCAHSEDGAMGLIINQRASHISFPDLLERLGIAGEETEDGISEDTGSLSIHVGGPVETGRGFVLHSADYFAEDSTLTIEDCHDNVSASRS